MLTRQSAGALVESGPLWQAITQHALVALADRTGCITYANAHFVHASGYSHDELIGQNHRFVKSDVHDDRFWAGVWRTIRSAQMWCGEVCNRARDGSLYWVRAQITPLSDATGRIEKYLVIGTDISTEKRANAVHELAELLQAANQTLRLHKFYLRAILDNLPHEIWLKDAQGRYLAVNQHLAKACDWDSPNAALGQTDHQLLPVALAEAYLRIDTQVMHSRQQLTREERDIHHPRRWVEVLIKPVFNEAGEVCGTLGMSHDISTRKQAQDQLQEHTALLNTILDLSPDGLVSFDMQRRVQYANKAFTRLTRIAPEQVIGRDEQVLAELLTCQCAPGCQFPDFAAMRRNPGSTQRHHVKLAHGNRRDLELVLQSSDSALVSHVLHLRDISHETEVERLKSEFMTAAAHELRTPMASIYGFAEILATQELDPLSRAEFTGVLLKHARGTVAVLNDLLDLARLEARHGRDFVHQTTTVQTLITTVLREFELPYGRLAPTLKAPAEAIVMQVDSRKMRQAVKNVLSNAYKYSPNGGQVSIEILSPRWQPMRAAQVGIRITDDGIGMSLAQQARVFERFYRADSSGKTLGTGLGMSIVHEIVTLHGGTVELSSRLGLGCSVTLWLPAEVQTSARHGLLQHEKH